MTPDAVEGVLERSVIEKAHGGWTVAPNLLDYQGRMRRSRGAEARRQELDGLPNDGGLNIAHGERDGRPADA